MLLLATWTHSPPNAVLPALYIRTRLLGRLALGMMPGEVNERFLMQTNMTGLRYTPVQDTLPILQGLISLEV